MKDLSGTKRCRLSGDPFFENSGKTKWVAG